MRSKTKSHILLINDKFEDCEHPVCIYKANNVCYIGQKLKDDGYQNISITNNIANGISIASNFKFDVIVLEIVNFENLPEYIEKFLKLNKMDKMHLAIYSDVYNVKQKYADIANVTWIDKMQTSEDDFYAVVKGVLGESR